MRSIKQSMICAILLFSFADSHADDSRPSRPKEREVNVSILFDYIKFSEKIILYEVPGDRILDVGDSKTIPMQKEFPFTKRLPQITKLRRGDTLPFAMVVENNTDTPMYFYSTPHTMKPEENAVGYQILCLCIHKIFIVPPKSRWYRIGSFTLYNTFLGDVIAFNHTIIGLTADEITKKKLGKLLAN